MPDRYDREQGTISPMMFIGLGGVGSRIVDRVAGRAAALPNWEAQLRSLTVFISIDSNRLDLNQLSHIPVSNRIMIGGFDRRAAVEGFRRAEKSEALQWLDPLFEPRRGLNPGAGQIRVDSRLGFFFHSPMIAQRPREVVSNTLASGIIWRQSNPKNYDVYIYSTLAGGTGSGTFLSMAYLVRKIIDDTREWRPRVVANLLLSTLLADVVGWDLHRDIHANTYAALKELEHMTRLNYRQERETGRSTEPFAFWNDENATRISQVESAPFFLSFIYDRPANFRVPDVESVIADAAFLQVFTPNIANTSAALDNYEKHLGELTRLPFEISGLRNGYAKSYGAMGAAALVLPAAGLLDYCSLRFAAEAVRSQLTFGVDRVAPADGRARAMARLAVDYSAPSFLAMGDEGCARVVNSAFLESVQELARQDARQELKDGYWYQLVESVDKGRITGTDEKGEVQHAESVLAQVRRKLEEARRPLILKVSIKERAFTFHKEGVNQYTEFVSRLKEEIRAARVLLEQGLAGLRRSAGEGEVIAELRLDPMSDRYVVLRLLEECERKWIPEAQKQFDLAKLKDINDPKVNDRLEEEYRSLQQTATESTWAKLNPFNKDQAFYAARDQAQDSHRSVASGARRLFDAEVQLSQYRELLSWLQKRSRQYARLARHMNRLVMNLEQQAEDMRRGQSASPRFALSVEVFETLEEPTEGVISARSTATRWPRQFRAS
jgi:hypothetical protein